MSNIDLEKEREVFESKHPNEFHNVLFEQTDDGVGQYIGKTSHYEDCWDADKLTYGWWSWVECAEQKQSEIGELKTKLTKVESGKLVIVPKEPTEKMMNAALICVIHKNGDVKALYATMIEAAQENEDE